MSYQMFRVFTTMRYVEYMCSMTENVVPISRVKNACATHDEVPMGVPPTTGAP